MDSGAWGMERTVFIHALAFLNLPNAQCPLPTNKYQISTIHHRQFHCDWLNLVRVLCL